LRSTHARTRLRRDLAECHVVTHMNVRATVYYRSGLWPASLGRIIVLQRKNLPPVASCRSLQQRRLHPRLPSLLLNTKRRPHRPADPPTANTSPTGAPPPTYYWTSRTIPKNSRSECEFCVALPRDGVEGGGGGCDISNAVSCCRSGTREVHNKLEKNRRAHLKECFELLKRQLPVSQDEKKSSNLSILHSALRHIQVGGPFSQGRGRM
jgi:hypothetical protein